VRINRAQEPRSSLQALLRLLLNLALSGSITYLGEKLKIGGEKGRIAEVGLGDDVGHRLEHAANALRICQRNED